MLRLNQLARRFIITKSQMQLAVQDPSILVIDVRTQGEVGNGHIEAKNWTHVPIHEIATALSPSMDPDDFDQAYDCKKPETDQKIVFYCKAGIRSGQAIKLAQQFGYNDVDHYAGGYDEWIQN